MRTKKINVGYIPFLAHNGIYTLFFKLRGIYPFDMIITSKETARNGPTMKGKGTMKTTFESMCGFSPRQYETDAPRPLYRYVNETAPAAVLALSNCFGLAVFDVSGDECIAAWHNGNSFSGAHRHAVYYSPAGRAFIKKGGRRWYLDDFIRAA